MLILQNISYTHPNKDLLFENINLILNNHEKAALIGNNGVGKSTLLKIIAQELNITYGQLKTAAPPYYIPQIFGQYNRLTVAQALKIDLKLNALNEILAGNLNEENYATLNDDWTIEQRCNSALDYWKLSNLSLSQKMETLSGGQKTKVFLAGLIIHQPEFILLDEPSNHLDLEGRKLLYDFIETTTSTLMVVSHDKTLLNLLNKIFELSKSGISTYGGDFNFYTAQKQIANDSLHHDLLTKEKALRKAKEKEKDTLERQQKLDARGKKKQEKSGVARIMMNTLRNSAENSSSKSKGIHAEKIEIINKRLHELRTALPDVDQMKFNFYHSNLHKGKVLFNAQNINHNYNEKALWQDKLTFNITSGERIAIKGLNGSGKTTLLKIILGLKPNTGVVTGAINNAVYIDQDYSLIKNELKVYEQAQLFNTSALQEHEIKIRLNRFLFSKNDWDKSNNDLSGGERMRLMLCCLSMSNTPPDMMVLDEPSNNLDLQNLEILTAALTDYQGTLIVVSHDEYFLNNIFIQRIIQI